MVNTGTARHLQAIRRLEDFQLNKITCVAQLTIIATLIAPDNLTEYPELNESASHLSHKWKQKGQVGLHGESMTDWAGD
jgi:hypothetical protein